VALIAEDAADRVEQMIVLTERLAALVMAETARIEARAPTAPAELVEEKERLANAYRLELARIKDDPTLVAGAPKPRLDQLLRNTARLQSALADHEVALGAVKFVAEGLVQAMAEEINRQRTQMRPYGSDGAHAGASAPEPVTINRTA
jgi:hypothetical protein